MRIVFDTNTIISAAIKKGSTPDLALTQAILFHEILVSLKSLEELNDTLQRKKFDVYLKEESRQEFYMSFVKLSQLIRVTSTIALCRDSKDNKFLELCVDGNADYLITGDNDLLVLKFLEGTKIITPIGFLSLFK